MRTRQLNKRNGYIVVVVAMMLIALLGFGAIAIDMSMVVVAKDELRSTVDATALATLDLITNLPADTPIEEVRTRANDFANNFMPLNEVMGRELHPELEVVIGNSFPEGVNRRYQRFAAGAGINTSYNAIKLQARLHNEDNTELTSILGLIFGRDSYELHETSFAVVKPLDILLVVDASGSMWFDTSHLEGLVRMVQLREGGGMRSEYAWTNLDEVWQAMHMEEEPKNGYVPSIHDPGGTGEDWGPVFGYFMESRGYGVPDQFISSNYRPRRFNVSLNSGYGLLYLPDTIRWTGGNGDPDVDAQAGEFAMMLVQEPYGYLPQEALAIMGARDEPLDADFNNRVLVALGIFGWSSGKAGGRGDREGWPSVNDDDVIDDGEMINLEAPDAPFGAPSMWATYAGSMTSERWATGKPEFANFRYCYGLKTFMEFTAGRSGNFPDLFKRSPLQPIHAVRNSIAAFMGSLGAFNNNDQVGVVRYGSMSVPLLGLQGTDDLSNINEALTLTGPWEGATNIADPMRDAIDILTREDAYVEGLYEPDPNSSQPPLPGASKTMILLTDGNANYPPWNDPAGKALAQADIARNEGIVIHTIALGTDADVAFCEEIARRTGGLFLAADGSYIVKQAQMTDFFNRQLSRTRRSSVVVGHQGDLEDR